VEIINCFLSGCPGVTFHLERDNQTSDYVQHWLYVPSMDEATICGWIETSDYNKHATIWSYAVTGNANEWFMAILNPSTFRITRNGIFDYNIPPLKGREKVR